MTEQQRQQKVKWGVLGAASIAVRKVIPGMQKGQWSEVTAIASRDLSKAKAAAGDLKIDKAYGSYDELLADPDVEAVYNPLPNHLQVPWWIQGAESGKHARGEKPIARNAAEPRTVRGARRGSAGGSGRAPSTPGPGQATLQIASIRRRGSSRGRSWNCWRDSASS